MSTATAEVIRADSSYMSSGKDLNYTTPDFGETGCFPFMCGDVSHKEESRRQELSRQTIQDLELDPVIAGLQAFAPSRMAKERIAFLIKHPYLDPEELKGRIDAVKQIADNEAIFNGMANLFEKRAGWSSKVARFLFRNPLDVGRSEFGNPYFRSRWISIPTALWTVFTAFSVAGQVGVVESVLDSFRHPTYMTWLVFTPFNVGASFFFNVFDQSHVAILSGNMRVRQARSFLANFDFGKDPSILAGLQQTCRANEPCLKPVALFSWMHPLYNRPLLAALQATGLSKLLTLPGRFMIRLKNREVLRVMSAMTEVETLYSLAKYYRANRSRLSLPKIISAPKAKLELVDGESPHLFLAGQDSVKNSVSFDEDKTKSYVLTGPNAGGKTVFMKMYLTNAVLAMAGIPGPYKSLEMTPAYVRTSFKKEGGSIESNESNFQNQMKRVADLEAIVFKIIKLG